MKTRLCSCPTYTSGGPILCTSQIDCSVDRKGEGVMNLEKFMRDVEEFALIYGEYKAERENKGKTLGIGSLLTKKSNFDNHLGGFKFPLTKRFQDMGFGQDGWPWINESPGMEFIGKRTAQPGIEFLGKRSLGTQFGWQRGLVALKKVKAPETKNEWEAKQKRPSRWLLNSLH